MKYIYFILLFSTTFCSISSAQFSYIWGGTGDPNSEFDGGLNDWTSLTIMDGDTISAGWLWEADGKADQGTYIDPENAQAINSASIGNGAMVFDADYFTTKEGYGSEMTSYLHSPSIDCSNEEKVTIVFTQYAKTYLSSFTIEVTNDGETWVPFEVNSLLREHENTRNNQLEMIDISSVAANQSDVQCRFVFSGNLYFWILDDVALVETPDNDIRMTNAFRPTVSAKVASPFLSGQEMSFACVIENFIGDVPVNVTVTAKIHDGETDEVLWEISKQVDNLTNDGDPNVQDTIYFDETLTGSEMEEIMTKLQMYYTRYSIEFEGYDYYSGDNDRSFTFELNDSESNQTDSRDTIGWDKDNYTIANFYKTGDWPNEYRVFVDYVSFGMQVENGDFLKNEIDIRIYKVDDSIDEDLLEEWNFDSPFTDIEFITEVGYAFGELADVPEQDEEFEWPILSSQTFDSLLIDRNSTYLVAVSNIRYDSIVGKVYYYGDRFTNLRKEPASIVEFDGTTWPSEILWNIGFHITFVPTDPDATSETLTYDAIDVFPNPASDIINLEIDLEQASDKVGIVITDITGKIVYSETYNDFKSGTKTLNTSNLPAGNYVLNLLTEEGYQTKKITVVK